MELKEIYLKAENAYYITLEKIDKTIPVTKITDAVDKVVPSFALLSVLVLLVVLFGVFSAFSTSTASLRVNVTDDSSAVLEGATVIILINGQELIQITNGEGIALFTVPLDAVVNINASKNEFESVSRTVTVTEQETTFGLVLISLASANKQRILLNRPDGSLLDEPVNVSFSCSNTGVQAPASQQSSTGIVEVIAPVNCGKLIATAESAHFKTFSGIELNGDSTPIYLAAFAIETGIVAVNVEDEDGLPVNNLRVALLSSLGTLVKESTTYNGNIVFEDIETGVYYISVSDSLNAYADIVSSQETVKRNETTTFDLTIDKTVKGVLTVQLEDLASNAPLANATVKLQTSLTSNPLSTKQTDSTGQVEFAIKDLGNYVIVAQHEDYLYESTPVNFTASTIETLALELLTPENSGRVTVKVKDEDGAFLENTEIYLFDAVSEWLYPIAPRITDANGEAIFRGVKSGSYYAFAVKGQATAESSSQTIDIRDEAYFEIALERGEAVVAVNVTDIEGNPISVATVEINPVGEGEAASTLTDLAGYSEVKLKANTHYYVRVSKNGFTSFTSESFVLQPNAEVTVNASLQVTLPGTTPSIQFLGLYTDEVGTEKVDQVEAGQNYFARLQVILPEESDFTEVGVHVRTGDKELLQKDNVFIRNVSAPNAAVIKGTSYNAPNSYANDIENISFGDAKWANIAFNDVRKGVYNVSIEIRVKSEVVPGEAVPFHYRVWAETPEGTILRDPLDAELGAARTAPGKHELYAKTNAKIFWEGQPAACDDSFCYSGERILDRDDEVFKVTPYALRVFGQHTLVFEITNNSNAVHNNAELRIKNAGENVLLDNALEITAYDVVNADAESFEQNTISVFEIPAIPLGNFTRNKTLQASIDFTPKRVDEASSFEVTIVSDGTIVFQKHIPVAALSADKLTIAVEPEVLPAFIGNDIKVTVTDSQQFAVKDARVEVYKLTSGNARLRIGSYTTNATGNAYLTLPAATPRSKYSIEVQKSGFESEAIVKTVQQDIVRFTPAEVNTTLQTAGKVQETTSLEALNVIPYSIEISDVSLTGYFKGLLDKVSIENYIDQFIGTTLAFNEARDLDIVRLKLIEGASVKRTEAFQGTLNVLAKSDDLGKQWMFTVPVGLTVETGEGVEFGECIVLNGVNVPEWSTISQGESIATEFEIINRCTVNGRPVQLQNLEAELTWQGNTIGVVELTVSNQETGESAQNLLQEKIKAAFFGKLATSETIYNGIVHFTPKAGHEGETAEFTIVLSAKIPTNEGLQIVKSNKDVQGNITIINLRNCLKIEPDTSLGLEIERNEKETSFEIDASECVVPLDIRFCGGAGNCRGGASEGGISVKPLTITNLRDKRSINVERLTIPGLYGLTIEAKPPGKSYTLVDTQDVIVQPKTSKFFYLDRYDFTLIGQGSQDSVSLFNHQYQEKVEVTADLCSWGEASESGLLPGIGLGLVGGALATISAVNAGIGAAAVPAAGAGAAGAGAAGAGAGGAVGGGAAAGGGLAFAPIAIGLVVAIGIALLVSYLLSDDCEDETRTETLIDYVINLIGDDKKIIIGNQDITATFNTDIEEVFAEDFEGEKKVIQSVGVILENQGLESLSPTYSILTVQAKERVHGDRAHLNARVDCDGGNFGFYNIGPDSSCRVVTEPEYTQKFHIRMKTGDQNQALVPLNFDTYECSAGALTGRTGPGALPKVSLDWSWAGTQLDSCNASNVNGVYCDATQFSMMLSKRMHALQEFLTVNENDLGCPVQDIETAEGINSNTEEQEVPTGKIGVKTLTTDFDATSNSVNVTAALLNNTNSSETLDVAVTLFNSATNEVIETCEYAAVTVNASATLSRNCNFENLNLGTYYVNASVAGGNAVLDTDPSIVIAVISEPNPAQSCWIAKSTDKVFGERAITRFLKGKDSVTWTSAVPSFEALDDLLEFDALLMRDAFTRDFREDFVTYYTTSSFADAPVYFTGAGIGENWKAYFTDFDKLQFGNRYVNDSPALSAAGTYKVEIITVHDEDWSFFNANNEPTAGIFIVFYRLNDAVPNNPLYSMPLDGLVGLEGASFNRQGYGTQFSNTDNEIAFNESLSVSSMKTFRDSGSNALTTVFTETEQDFRRLNASPATRGNLLEIKQGFAGNEKLLTFSPSYATPVMARITHDVDTNPFSVFYGVSVDGSPRDTGNNLTFWEGAGACLNFNGVPVTESFAFQPDRAAIQNDQTLYWETSYGLDFQQATKAGDVYVRTVFYTPRGTEAALNILAPLENMELFTADATGDSVALNGVQTMKYNNAGNSDEDKIDSIKDIFKLVEQQKVCVTNTGVKARYWWNPKAIYEQTGAQRNIHADTISLVAGESCIAN